MKRIAVIAGTLGMASCAPIDQPDATLAGVEEDTDVRILGEPRTCLRTASIRDSDIRDDRTIDFEMAGGDIYRARFARPCPGLRVQDGFTYSTSIGQLCRGEIIYVLENYGGELERGAGCAMSDFTPIEYVDPVSDAPLTMDE